MNSLNPAIDFKPGEFIFVMDEGELEPAVDPNIHRLQASLAFDFQIGLDPAFDAGVTGTVTEYQAGLGRTDIRHEHFGQAWKSRE